MSCAKFNYFDVFEPKFFEILNINLSSSLTLKILSFRLTHWKKNPKNFSRQFQKMQNENPK